MRDFFAILVKSIGYALMAVVALVLTVAIGLQIPAVQTKAVRQLAGWVSAKMQFPIDIKHVSIKWFDSMVLEGVTVKDRQQRPMIDVERLEVNYNLRNLIDSSAHNIHLDEVLLYQPDVRLVKNPRTGDLNIDEFIARIGELLAADTTQPKKPDNNVPFTIGRATVADGSFQFDDPRQARMNDKRYFDYYHFRLERINGNVRNFLALGDTIALNISNLKTVDRDSRLRVHKLNTQFLWCAKKMEMNDLYARINESTVREQIVFLYDSPSAFGDFNREVTMIGRLRNSLVTSADLGYFSEYLRNLRETWALTTDFVGTVDNFKLRRTDLRFGPGLRSRLAGNIGFKNLPRTDNIITDFDFTPSEVNMADIRQYYPDKAFNDVVQQLGTVTFAATFAGLFDDFKTAGTFRTALGNVTGDLKLKLGEQSAQTTYTANLRGENFALGKLINQPDLIGQLDGQGRITGRGGLDLTKASVDIDGKLTRFGFQGYDYRNVTVRGNLQKAFFHGQVSLRDPNLSFDLDGESDLGSPRNHFDIRGSVQHANLRALGYTSDTLTVSTELDVIMDGNTIDQLEGRANFRNAMLVLNRRPLNIDTLQVLSAIQPNGRLLTVDSDFLTAELRGNFLPNQTVNDLTTLAKEYALYFTGDLNTRQAYYYRKLNRAKIGSSDRYDIQYRFATRNLQPLLDFALPSVRVAQGTTVEGRFSVDRTALLTANVQTDSLRIGDIRLGASEVDLTTSKFVDNQEVLASVVATSQKQALGSLAPTENLLIEAAWDVDHIDFSSSVQQQNSTNRADLNGELRFSGNALDLMFHNSNIRVLDSTWTVSPDGLVRKVGRNYTLTDLMLSHSDQRVMASGRVGTDTAAVLRIQADNFLLETLNPLLNTRLAGTLDGTAKIRNVYQTPIVESNLTVDRLRYDDFLIGNVNGLGVYDPSGQRINIDARLNRDGVDALTLRGSYTPVNTDEAFDLKAVFTNADLRVLEPFTEGLFSNIGGTASGTIDLTGPATAPILKGALDVQKGRLTMDYLKAEATFDDRVYFGDGEIIARRLTLRDPLGNIMNLRGGVYHDQFRYFQLRFDADLRNFRIMNTAAKDNDLFYGAAFATGKAELYGPIDNLTIRADVTSNKGTRIYIPLDQATSVSSAEDDFVQFIDRTPVSTTAVSTSNALANIDKAEPTLDLSGIKMDFNFDITPDAYCEIQLDRQTGDIIKSNGAGRINMQIDTKGAFSMTGNYEIQQGEYTFTFENVINKRFQIRPNSRITWTGDPYRALLNVSAAYTQYTSLQPLLTSLYNGASSGASRNPDSNRRYPVDLIINLDGELQSPAVTYDLEVKEYPASSDFRQAVTAFEARLQANEQELTRQVSSVLLFSQLLPEGSSLFDQGNVNSGIANSVGELLSNQISRIASNIDKNLDVGVSFGGFTSNTNNENLLNNLQLRFSYRFLNDRFRISRDGGFTYGQNGAGQTQTSAASLLGEWTLEYWVTPDGRFRAKMYNRNQQNVLSQATTNSTLTTGGGISLQYTRTFNRLFGGSRKPSPGVSVPDAEQTPKADPSGEPLPGLSMPVTRNPVSSGRRSVSVQPEKSALDR
ncbi:translocation/assembly module TamB [Rudanella paleaurantiibacter]|uniref:Translocation/assembly module TamB n=1 Tax=Rudanella paleaurantiibacter TaxID=2614655 RepID=A0A7J5TY91_9BACT|nr:translocation/assembly module TamB domain-containing protein [Rudanella paleaurantiibacter]KAB7728698.1 translocation/assembly module TamB [Rudanella paleaurantiibacter]